MVSVTKMDGISAKQAAWVNANYFYYTIDNWQAKLRQTLSNGLIPWHADAAPCTVQFPKLHRVVPKYQNWPLLRVQPS